MSKALATAAEIVGVVALIATGVGAAAGVGIGISASVVSTAATVAKVAGFAAAALMATSALTARTSRNGPPDEWKADPDAGMDIVFGETYNSGHIIYRQAYGDTNKYQAVYTHWSIGPVQSIDQLFVDQIAYQVAGGVVQKDPVGRMWHVQQLGRCPEPNLLQPPPLNPYGWTAQSHLSGKAVTAMTFQYDAKAKPALTSIPTCGWRGRGVLGYDPRQDSTYPGGNGSQRWNDEATWAWSENPFVIALTWCIGWQQNGKLVAGVGLPITGLLVDQFVEGANVADANGWKAGGVKSTTDDKWDVLKDILQAGAGEPLRLGALLGCLVQTPRVSLALVDRDALAQGDISVVAMQARRDRINAVSPRYTAELVTTVETTSGTQETTTTWAQISGAPIIVADYVAADGRQRRKQVDFPLVQCRNGADPTQVAQLSRYAIENAREFGPITLPLKIRWLGYKPGDVVTLALPDAGLPSQPVMILTRSLDAGSGVVTITARSETGAKHAFALGQTTVAPASPSLPFNGWQFNPPKARAAARFVTQTASYPLSSTADTITVAAFEGTLDDGTSVDIAAGAIGGLTAATAYAVFANSTGSVLSAVEAPALAAMADSDNVFVGWQATAAQDGSYPAPAAAPGGYGGTGGSPRAALN